jgi:chromosome condensin MukBEF ATPase and DNA-binding subunit MukB
LHISFYLPLLGLGRAELSRDFVDTICCLLDVSNRGKAEVEKNVKRYISQIQELQRKIEEEQRLRDEARESYVLTERRCNVIISEVEEIRTALEQSVTAENKSS